MGFSSHTLQEHIRVLAKLGTGALAPLFCEAEAITSDEFCKKSIDNVNKRIRERSFNKI
jgi:hypothetical protein